MPGAQLIERLMNAGKRWVRSGTLAHPDNMDSQALEQQVPQFEHDDGAMGLVHTNSRLKEELTRQLCEFVTEFFTGELGIPLNSDVSRDVEDFHRLRANNPAREATGGATSDVQNLWLHLLVRQLQPTVMVESGTWVGRSLYTLRTAWEAAELHSFDVSYRKLLYESDQVRYHEYDWSKSDVSCAGVGFGYFDDHINNGRRIREASEKGFRYLVFDQCVSIGTTHYYKYPGLPSALMIGERMLQEGDVLEWEWRGEKLRYEYTQAHTFGAEELIETVKPFPCLSRWFGKRTSDLVYVKLKEGALDR